jgi:hypothetical protein
MHEEMFNILSYKGSENQNYIEIPSHPSQKGNHQENRQVLGSLQGKELSHTVGRNIN